MRWRLSPYATCSLVIVTIALEVSDIRWRVAPSPRTARLAMLSDAFPHREPLPVPPTGWLRALGLPPGDQRPFHIGSSLLFHLRLRLARSQCPRHRQAAGRRASARGPGLRSGPCMAHGPTTLITIRFFNGLMRLTRVSPPA